jgi:hypothetical protein
MFLGVRRLIKTVNWIGVAISEAGIRPKIYRPFAASLCRDRLLRVDHPGYRSEDKQIHRVLAARRESVL